MPPGYCPNCGFKLFEIDRKYMEKYGKCSYCVTYKAARRTLTTKELDPKKAPVSKPVTVQGD